MATDVEALIPTGPDRAARSGLGFQLQYVYWVTVAGFQLAAVIRKPASMSPTIFAWSIRGLGEHTKLASSLVVVSIVGGAITPPLMGHIENTASMRLGLIVPLVCLVLIAVYGAFGQMLETRDIAN